MNYVFFNHNFDRVMSNLVSAIKERRIRAQKDEVMKLFERLYHNKDVVGKDQLSAEYDLMTDENMLEIYNKLIRFDNYIDYLDDFMQKHKDKDLIKMKEKYLSLNDYHLITKHIHEHHYLDICEKFMIVLYCFLISICIYVYFE